MSFKIYIKVICITAFSLHINYTFAQNKNCIEKYRAFNARIQDYKYEEASVILKELEQNKCKLFTNDFYNAACIYSVLSKSNIALSYLQKAVQQNYYDTAHMAIDKDLDNIRNLQQYKKLISLIKTKLKQDAIRDSINAVNAASIRWANQFDIKNKAKWQFLKKNFTKINLLKMADVIPYIKDNKWGYMDNLGNALTKPLFDYADFASANGLLFLYNKNYFFYNKKAQIDKLVARSTDGVKGSMYEPNYNFELTNTPGFTLKNNEIVSHYSEYAQIGLLNSYHVKNEEYKNYLQGKTWAIVKNKVGKMAIIDSIGNPLNDVYNFKYYMDGYIDLSDASYKAYKKVFFKLKQDGNELLFELNGKAINTEKPVASSSYFYNYSKEMDDIILSIYSDISNQLHKIYYADDTQNLLIIRNENLELLFKKFYTKIIGYNGVCKDKFDGYTQYVKNIKNLFILVKDVNETFYVDMNGKEYKLPN
jgi:hypothetical protein